MDLLTGQRLYDPSDLQLDIRFDRIQEAGPGCLFIEFTDGHAASFSMEEILAEAAMAHGESESPALWLWDGILTDLPRAVWSSSPNDVELKQWLDSFLRLGFIIFSGVPCVDNEVLRVAEVFGGIRNTNFGAMFDVQSVPNATDLALTSLKLDPHTDNPYRAPVPGI